MKSITNTLLLALTLCIGVASMPSDSKAFYTESRYEVEGVAVPLRYAPTEVDGELVDVEFRINTASVPADSGTDVQGALQGAFASWGGADCSGLSFSEGATSDSVSNSHWSTDEGAVYVLVYFTDSDAEWTDGASVGHFWFGHDGEGTLVGATITLNSRDHAWDTEGDPSRLDVQSTVTALIGRSLGLTSAEEGNATFPRYTPGDVARRELGTDDLAGLLYLYPITSDTCDAPTEPADVCDGSRLDPPCPPRPVVDTPDGGTRPPTPDAGSIGSADAGISPISDGGPNSGADSGTGGGDGDGGCSVAQPGEGSGSRAPWLLMLALGAFIGRRRRD